VTMCTYALINDQWAHPAHPLVSSSKTKPCQFSSVTSPLRRFSYLQYKIIQLKLDAKKSSCVMRMPAYNETFDLSTPNTNNFSCVPKCT